MAADCVYSIIGKKPFDLVIKNVKIINVFTESIVKGDIAVTGDTIAYIGKIDFPCTARREIDGAGRYAVPGLIDAHMHIESSMMAPARFAELILACGTTTVAADPHEIGNVCGAAGVRALAEASANMPLHVLMMAPSTIPSAPGLERSGWSVGAAEMEEMLDIPGVAGLGEVMDFNGVADGDERLLGVVEAARKRGVIMDGHVPALTGARLQAFRSTGVDADHTDMSLPRAREKLAAGFSIQIQNSFLAKDLIEYVDQFPLQDRIMLITDDVPFNELIEHGHLNANVRRAIALGLRPLRAIRYATINAASRLRLYDRGAVSPGYKADILLMKDLEEIKPDMVFSDGQLVAENGRCLVRMERYKFPEEFYHSIHVLPLAAEDFALKTDLPPEAKEALIHVLGCNEVTTRTKNERRWVPVRDGQLDITGLVKVGVIYRHGCGLEKAPGKEVSLGLLAGFPDFQGALASTYAHDSHNLTVYGTDESDMALAANRLIEIGGGLCAVQDGKILAEVPLPVAGVLTEGEVDELKEQFGDFFRAVEQVGLRHSHPMMFMTLMTLAVSLEIKCTDMGLVDTLEKKFIPLVVEAR